jgi:CBS domain-containing protein/sporulation protein YlmC with PRC-barrel domain
MVLFSEMFISKLIHLPVIDRGEHRIGKVEDVLLILGEQFSRIPGILLRTEDGSRRVLAIGEADLIGSKFVLTHSPKDRIVLSALRDEDILLRRDILDKQIVDTEGARVVRVNDLKLAKVGSEVRLIAVDVGIMGILRRLGFDSIFAFIFKLFKIKVPGTLIGWNYVELLEADLAKGHIKIPHKRVNELHPADIADIMSHVHKDERRAIFASLTDKTAAEALHELEPKIQAMLLLTVDTKKALGILNKMPSDEAADVLGDIAGEKTEELLRLMRPKKAEEIRGLLKHPEETAGGLMTTEYISLPREATVEHAINMLREKAPDAETIYYLYVVENGEKLVGVLSLRMLIVAQPATPISEIMVRKIISVHPEANQREVAEVISKYNLLAVPVVDENKKIQGIVTVDDVIDFILPPISRRKRHMLG